MEDYVFYTIFLSADECRVRNEGGVHDLVIELK